MIPTDVLIVGDGASGAYCAWGLSKEYGSKIKIILAEKCNFLGGKLVSVRFLLPLRLICTALFN